MGANHINELSPLERPREKFHYRGASALTDAELLAILIGSGTRGKSVLQLCEEVLNLADHDLKRLANMQVDELCRIKGIGEAKAVIILAAMELSERLLNKNRNPEVLADAEAVKSLVIPYFISEKKRVYILVLLNFKHELLATSELKLDKRGLPEIAALIRLAVDSGAARMVLTRNQMDPPERLSEKKFFRELKAAAKMVCIAMNELVIIS